MANTRADIAAKIIVIALIALFLGLTAFNMFTGKSAASAGSPPQGGPPGQSPPPGGGGASGGGQPQRGQASGQAGAPRGSSAITVSVRRMERGTIRQIVRLNGDVTSRTEVAIFPDTSGKISRLLKGVGDTVARGETIGYVDPSRAGSAFVENPVVAAVSGTIITLPVSQGETVGTSTRIATIGSLGNLKITIYVAEKYSAYLSRGLQAVVTFPAAPEEQFTARVTAVSPVVNSANRTIETDLVLEKNDPRIKPGMFANVDLVIREKKDTFVLPKGAVKNYNDEQVVYLVDGDSSARRVKVTTGLSNDSEVEILSGLSEGDRVITAGAVTDGSAVRIAAGAFE